MTDWPAYLTPPDQRELDRIEVALADLKRDYIAKCALLRRKRDNIRAKYRVKRARERD